MTQELPLEALNGRNPLCYLAALGVLDVLHRAGRAATLRWDDALVPTAYVGGAADLDDLVAVVDADRAQWVSSPVLNWPPEHPLTDAKPDPSQLAAWARTVAKGGDESDVVLWSALVAEGGFDRSGTGKPTHLHFTAGQQRFLAMVRELQQRVDVDAIREAVAGPWRYESALPSLSWDARGERIYALRGGDPAKEKRLGVPGADWLAVLGLRFYPVAVAGTRLHTTACDVEWKRSALRWPLWNEPLGADVVASLVADVSLVGSATRLRPGELAVRGVTRVLRAPIRRSDQGGYGSFGAPDVLAEAQADEHHG